MGKTAIPNWTKSLITGLGDDAYSADHGGKMTFPISPSLSVKEGAVFLVISAKIPKATLEKTKEVEKRIAGAILDNLTPVLTNCSPSRCITRCISGFLVIETSPAFSELH